MAEKEKEDVLAIHEKRHTYAKKLSNTHNLHTSKAYNEAVEKHLMDKEGLVDFELLDKDNIQKEFVKTMSDFYIKKIKDVHGLEAKNDFHKQVLMQAYMGTTPEELKRFVGQYGKQLDYDLFPRVAATFNKRVHDNLYNVATEHFSDKDIKDVTKKLGLEDKLTQPLSIEEARTLLNAWRDHGQSLSESHLRELIGLKLKKEKKKKAA